MLLTYKRSAMNVLQLFISSIFKDPDISIKSYTFVPQLWNIVFALSTYVMEIRFKFCQIVSMNSCFLLVLYIVYTD